MTLAEPVYITTTTGANMLLARQGMQLDKNMLITFERRNVAKITIVSDTPDASPKDGGVGIVPKKPQPAPVPMAAPTAAAPPQEKPKPQPEKNFVPVKSVVDEKLKEEAVESVKQLFDCFSSKDGMNKTTAYRCVNDVNNVVDDLLSTLQADPTGLVHINDLKSYDEYTYHHSLSVSILSIATGRELGLDSGTLQRLGRCAMMHDIGKQLLPFSIIGKRGKLTDEEFLAVKNHPVLGAATLKKYAVGDNELWNGIMFHHERTDGSGYPKGLKGKDIPLFSKIISVADVYDAITSFRPYRSPMLPSDAFEIIRRDIGKAFEFDIVKAFFSKLEIYPLNTIVELSDGRLGMVVECGQAHRLRPVIRIWGSTELVDLVEPINQKIEIVSVMSPSDLPSGYEIG
ncbi:MAG: HD-GYP domain-containing protein [Defluviitaleaceae bacterium]|nr:HD-GYP domain-containing protein [Defluviitaleaceae bacterium]